MLRHPGIRKEVESKIHCGPSRNFNIKDEFWEPPSSCIKIRKCYWGPQQNNNDESPTPPCVKNDDNRKLHEIHVRIQPVIQDPEERTKKERRVAAALALYHFYKPKARDGEILSLRDFTKVFFRNGQKPWARDLLSQKSR